MISSALFSAACFGKVFLAIFQQKNVQHNRYAIAFLTSVMLTFADVAFVRLATTEHLLLALGVGALSNGSAVIAAMWFHKRVFK